MSSLSSMYIALCLALCVIRFTAGQTCQHSGADMLTEYTCDQSTNIQIDDSCNLPIYVPSGSAPSFVAVILTCDNPASELHLTISGNDPSSLRELSVSQKRHFFLKGDVTLNLKYLKLVAINPDSNNPDGGIFMRSGALYTTHVWFDALYSGNGISIDGTTVPGEGGAIQVQVISSTFTSQSSIIDLKESTFTNCKAQTRGGAVSVNDNYDLNITNTRFTSCELIDSSGQRGGAVSFVAGKNLVIIQSTFESNVASDNGAYMYAKGSAVFVKESTSV